MKTVRLVAFFLLAAAFAFVHPLTSVASAPSGANEEPAEEEQNTPEEESPDDAAMRAAFEVAAKADTVASYLKFLAEFEEVGADSRSCKEARAKIRGLVSQQIARQGLGKRFVVKDLVPVKGGHVGSIVVTTEIEDDKCVEAKKEDPKTVCSTVSYPEGNPRPLKEGKVGNLVFFGQAMVDTRSRRFIHPLGTDVTAGNKESQITEPMGNLTLLRFTGQVKFFGVTFNGDKEAPLSFLLMKPYGAVHIGGKGTVTTKAGKKTSL